MGVILMCLLQAGKQEDQQMEKCKGGITNEISDC